MLTEQEMDPYTLLQLEPGASGAQIKKAWKRLARLHHPDLNPDDPEAGARFQRIKDAYEMLRSGSVPVASGQEMDEDWLDTVDWMIAFRQRVVMQELMPRLVGAYGHGSALAWALRQAMDLQATAEALPEAPSTWRLRRLKLDVILSEEPSMQLAALQRNRKGVVQLVLCARPLWQHRGADEDALRERVFAAVDHGLAAAVPMALGTSSAPPTLQIARKVDRRVALDNLIIRGIWAGAAVLVGMMSWIMATA